MFHTQEKSYASKCNFSALFSDQIVLYIYGERCLAVFSRRASQIQARKTVLKQKSRSSTSKFWMKYNFIFVHAKFQDMFHTQEKSYALKCNFSALCFPTKLCCIYMASDVLLYFHVGQVNFGPEKLF